MRLKEINEILSLYENYGSKEAIARLYELQKIEKERLLYTKLAQYIHETNKNNNAFFYTSDNEQMVTNNTGSIIYFNKKLFDFTNINNRKIVIKESFEVNKEKMQEMLNVFKFLSKSNFTSTNDIEFINDNELVVSTKHNSVTFDKQEFELIAQLLNYPTFNLSDDISSMYMEGNNGYAYILGKKYPY